MEDEICVACTERISTLRDEIIVLREKSQMLEIENPRISYKIGRREIEISEFEKIMYKINLQKSQKKRVIAFVHAVECAHEYYDFKDYLREECGSDKYDYWQDDIEDILMKVPKDRNMFSGILEEDIDYAVDEHIMNVRTIHKFEGVHRLCESEYREARGITSELTVDDYKEMDRMFPHLYLHKRYENYDLYRDENPVYLVVFQSREKNYVLDENPEVELFKIEESTEDFDDGYIFGYEEQDNIDGYIFNNEEHKNTENDVPEKAVDITRRLTEALEKYSKLRKYGKKTVKNVIDDSSAADHLDKYSKHKNFGEQQLDKNRKLEIRNQGKDSDSCDCGVDWVIVSVP